MPVSFVPNCEQNIQSGSLLAGRLGTTTIDARNQWTRLQTMSPEPKVDAVVEAACSALISLERVSAALPEVSYLPDLRSEIEQATESLREAIRELRLAGIVKPSIQELDFVLPAVSPRPA
jgi:hypothetical protein